MTAANQGVVIWKKGASILSIHCFLTCRGPLLLFITVTIVTTIMKSGTDICWSLL